LRKYETRSNQEIATLNGKLKITEVIKVERDFNGSNIGTAQRLPFAVKRQKKLK
jgi:hypothetical protein